LHLLTIHLHNLLFHAHHGLYDEEQLLGNEFEVNITIKHIPITAQIISLDQTINYAAVYDMVKKRMNTPTPLLETLAQELCQSILENFIQAESVLFSIKKLNPPITQFQGSVGVSFEMNKNQL
jgi:dihydroneopterin aldolase